MVSKTKVKDTCQCNLCDCGRHRCAVHQKVLQHMPLPNDPSSFTTSYQDQFKTCNAPPRCKPCVPLQMSKLAKCPFNGSTESKTAFKEKIIPPRYQREKETYKKPEGDMMMITTKHAAYTEKQIVSLASYKPNKKAPKEPVELPLFDGITTSRAFYKPYKVQRQQGYSEYPTNLKCPTDPFDGTTTSKHSYPAYSVGERTKPIKPTESCHVTGEPFCDTTTTGACYKGLPGQQMKPIPHEVQYQAPKGEMSTETTTGAHFKQLSSSAPPRPLIPHTVREAPAEFVGTTTNMETYPSHPVTKRPQPREREIYVAPTERMDGVSMHRAFYIPHSIQRRRRLSPLQKIKSAPLPKFESKTTHKEQFRKWKIVKEPMYGEPPVIVRQSSEKMNTKTTKQSDFVYDRSKVERVRPIIPQVKVVRSDQPIEDQTSYRNEYQGIQPHCRLGALLVNT